MYIDICEQPKKIGPCRARIPRFYFNSTDGKCKEFGWGGCDPNENNFKTKEDCEKICIGISQWQYIYDKCPSTFFYILILNPILSNIYLIFKRYVSNAIGNMDMMSSNDVQK